MRSRSPRSHTEAAPSPPAICAVVACALFAAAAGCDSSRPTATTETQSAPAQTRSAPTDTQPAPAGPNLLLITVDTLRADHLACYGGQTGAGLDLCEIFADGARYTWAFSTAPSTAPSITSILTSRYPRDHGVTQFARTRLDASAVTLAELLSDAGYATAAILSNPVLDASRNLGQGFDHYDDDMQRIERNRPTLREREAADATDRAIAWVRRARSPWFLWVHYQDPHGPYEPPDATPARDAATDRVLPVLEDHSGLGGIPAYQVLPGHATLGAYAWRYAQEIRYLERHVERLVTELDALGSRPAILLTADHGEAFGEDDFYLAHGHSVGIDQIRVPLFWRPHDPIERAVIHAPVSNVDAMPTLLAAAGLAPPGDLEGRALPVDAAESSQRAPRALFAEHRLRIAVVEGADYYARDRRPLSEPVHDAISGGQLPPMPPRTSALGDDGRWDPYAETDIPEPLEARVDAFLSEAETRRGETQAELDPVTRDALRALGYLE